LTSELMLLIGESGPLTRLAGLAAPGVARVSVTSNGHTTSVPTRSGAALEQVRFFFLQIRAASNPPPSHWTLYALDNNGKRKGSLRV
jgi:hypothetical protein